MIINLNVIFVDYSVQLLDSDKNVQKLLQHVDLLIACPRRYC